MNRHLRLLAILCYIQVLQEIWKLGLESKHWTAFHVYYIYSDIQTRWTHGTGNVEGFSVARCVHFQWRFQEYESISVAFKKNGFKEIWSHEEQESILKGEGLKSYIYEKNGSNLRQKKSNICIFYDKKAFFLNNFFYLNLSCMIGKRYNHFFLEMYNFDLGMYPPSLPSSVNIPFN